MALITLTGMDEAIANLNANPDTLKGRLVQLIRSHFISEESLENIAEISADSLVRELWEVSDETEIRRKKKNLSSLKSSLNKSLKKLTEQGKNPEGLVISRDNIFTVSDDHKNNLLNKMGITAGQDPSDLISTIRELLGDLKSHAEHQKDAGSLLDELDKTRDMIAGMAGTGDKTSTHVKDDSDITGEEKGEAGETLDDDTEIIADNELADIVDVDKEESSGEEADETGEGGGTSEEIDLKEDEELETAEDKIPLDDDTGESGEGGEASEEIDLEEDEELEIIEDEIPLEDDLEEIDNDEFDEIEADEDVEIIDEETGEDDEASEELDLEEDEELEIIKDEISLEDDLEEIDEDEFDEIEADEDVEIIDEETGEDGEASEEIDLEEDEELEIVEDEIPLEDDLEEIDDDEFGEIEADDVEIIDEEADETGEGGEASEEIDLEEDEELEIVENEIPLEDDLEVIDEDEFGEIEADDVEIIDEEADETGEGGEASEEIDLEEDEELEIVEDEIPLEDDLEVIDEDEFGKIEADDVEIIDEEADETGEGGEASEEIDLEEDEELEIVEDEIPLEDDLEVIDEDEFGEIEADDVEIIDEEADETGEGGEASEEIELEEDEELEIVEDEIPLEDDIEEIDDDEFDEIEADEDVEILDDDTEIIEEDDLADILEVDEEDITGAEGETAKPSGPPPMDLSHYIEPDEALAAQPETLAESHEDYIAQILERFMPKFIKIPAGHYPIGNFPAKSNERPSTHVTLNSFHISQLPVTNDLFDFFVRETGYETDAERINFGTVVEPRIYTKTDPETGRSILTIRPGTGARQITGANWRHPAGPGSSLENKGNHPVVQVSRQDALAFATWAGKKLPSEDEWEAAARGTKGLIFPWGNEWNDTFGNFEKSQIGDTCPVTRYGKESISPFGVYDMLGNVFEWTATTHKPPQRTPVKPQLVAGKHTTPTAIYVLKGGCWASKNIITAAIRLLERDTWSNIIGFRCAV